MSRLKLLLCACLVAGGLAVAAGDAVAAQSPTTNCTANSGSLTRHFSAAALSKALATMPAQVKEYTPCYQVIQQQLDAEIAGHHLGGGGSGSGGSFLSTPLLIVLIVIVLGGGGFAYLAYRRNSGGGGPQPPATGDTPGAVDPPDVPAT